MLVGAFVMTVVIALTSSFPAMIALPQDIPVAIVALVTSGILLQMQTATADAGFATVVAAIALTTIMTGLVFVLIGRFQLSSFARYIPYPVIGGFLAGSGMLLLQGAMGVMLNVNFTFANILELLNPNLALRWMPGVVFGVGVLMALRRWSHFLIMPAVVVGATVLFYLVWFGAGLSVEQAQQEGWLLAVAHQAAVWQPISPQLLQAVDWNALLSQADKMLAIILISAIALLMNVSGLELFARRDIELDRELQAAGLANVLAGAAGSAVGYQTLSLSALAYRTGGASRAVGLVTGGVIFAALFLGADLYAFFPRVVLGGLLFFLGLAFVAEWVYDAWFKLARVEYALMFAILVVVTFVGFLEGVILGILIASVLFVFNYSRTNVVRQQWTGELFRSMVERSPQERALLRTHGKQLLILQLQAFLFFGTAQGLLNQIRARLQDPETPLQYILLDFQRVPGVDSSAVASFVRMKQLLQVQQIELVLTGVTPQIRQQLARAGLDQGARYFLTLDHGVEWCEEQILQHHRPSDAQERASFQAQLAQIFNDARALERLQNYLERIELAAETVFIRQGEQADAMYFVEEGEVCVDLELPNGRTARLRTVRRGAIVGEVAMYLGGERTASVRTLAPTTLYRLSAASIQRMEQDAPDLAAALHKWIAAVIAERLADNVRVLEQTIH